MRFCKTWGVFILALLVMAPAVQARNELEASLGWYFPSNVELEGLNTTLEYHDTLSYGARYGYRADGGPWGIGVLWSHVNIDAAASDANRLGCSTCDFSVDFADFSFEWYPGNSEWGLYGGLGWASGDFEVNLQGSSNDRSITDDAFTYHLGTSYAWRFGDAFYIRPDARIRFLQLDQSGRGKYDSEDPEVRLGFGWRF
jgi:hypothetical protein